MKDVTVSLPNSLSPSFTLFFSVPPFKETLAVRDIEASVSADSLAAKVELLSGIVSGVCSLCFGEKRLSLDEDLHLGDEIRNGSLITVKTDESISGLVELICDRNDEELLDELRSRRHQQENYEEEGQRRGGVSEEFVAAFLCCREGHIDLLDQILTADLVEERTQFGRRLTHVAAAHDRASVLEYLLSRFPVDLFQNDIFHKSTLDITAEFSATISEVFLRNCLSKRRGTAKSRCKRNLDKIDATNEGCRERSQLKSSATESKSSHPKFKYLNSGGELTHTFSSRYSDHAHANTCVSNSDMSDSKTSKGSANKKKSIKSKSTACSQTQLLLDKEPPQQKTYVKAKPSTPRRLHRHCNNQKPFLAFHAVTPEELKAVTVEYIPLERQTPSSATINHSVEPCEPVYIPTAPCSSLNNSTEDIHHADEEDIAEKDNILENRKRVFKKYTKVKAISYRAQSAKYHRSQYHLTSEEDITLPKPRPKTAGSRYREWKTWMTDKYKREEEREKLQKERSEKRRENIKAFERWLAKKEKLHGTRYLTESDSSDGETNCYDSRKAYEKWIENKKKTGFFKRQDQKRAQELKEKSENDTNSDKNNVHNKRVTIYEIGNTDPLPVPRPDPHTYMRAYHDWVGRKDEFEAWCRKKGISRPDGSRMEYRDLIRMRTTLLLDGMTYDEWLGLKERESQMKRSASSKP